VFDEAKERLRRARDAAYGQVLEPGEALLASGMVAAAFVGDDRIEQAPTDPQGIEAAVRAALERVERLPALPAGFLAVAGFLADPLPGLDVNVERLLGGDVGEGDATSLAALVKAGLRDASVELAVTDRRLLLAVDGDEEVLPEGSSVPVRSKRATAAVPRRAVAGVRRRSRPLERGRIELLFVDGSRIVLTAGVVSARRATRLVDALVAAPGTAPEAPPAPGPAPGPPPGTPQPPPGPPGRSGPSWPPQAPEPPSGAAAGPPP